MKVLTFRYQGRVAVGALTAENLIRPFETGGDAARDGLGVLMRGDFAPNPDPAHHLKVSEVDVLAPIPVPRRNIFCIGKNYHAHVREFARSGYDANVVSEEAPEAPIVFTKLPQCVIPDGGAIECNEALTQALDYEAELAVIIGRAGRAIPAHRALEHVWGYTIVNDVTARDLQKVHKQWFLGKSQDGFCPMGPYAVTRDELDLAHTPIRCWVNDELRQDGNTSMMIYDVPALIEVLSRGITLLPGDVIATGTPAGVGVGFTPPKFLQPGDRVRIEIPPIGVLTNHVIGHEAAAASTA